MESTLPSLETRLGDPSLWTDRPEEARALQNELATTTAKIVEMPERWEKLTNKAGSDYVLTENAIIAVNGRYVGSLMVAAQMWLN